MPFQPKKEKKRRKVYKIDFGWSSCQGAAISAQSTLRREECSLNFPYTREQKIEGKKLK